jgi:hypothetical protein
MILNMQKYLASCLLVIFCVSCATSSHVDRTLLQSATGKSIFIVAPYVHIRHGGLSKGPALTRDQDTACAIFKRDFQTGLQDARLPFGTVTLDTAECARLRANAAVDGTENQHLLTRIFTAIADADLKTVSKNHLDALNAGHPGGHAGYMALIHYTGHDEDDQDKAANATGALLGGGPFAVLGYAVGEMTKSADEKTHFGTLSFALIEADSGKVVYYHTTSHLYAFSRIKADTTVTYAQDALKDLYKK